MLPFYERKFEDKYIRLFKENLDNDELVWHRDREFRVVEVLSPGGWQFQFDNEIPITLSEGDVINIPALEWHRIIRGNEPLVISVEKLSMQEAKKRKINKAYLKGTRKSNKEMKREINKCAKKPRPKSCYEKWTADKTYEKSKLNKESAIFEVDENLNELKEILNEALEDKLIKNEEKYPVGKAKGNSKKYTEL